LIFVCLYTFRKISEQCTKYSILSADVSTTFSIKEITLLKPFLVRLEKNNMEKLDLAAVRLKVSRAKIINYLVQNKLPETLTEPHPMESVEERLQRMMNGRVRKT